MKFNVNNIEYYSAENYFQCQKATNQKDFEKVRNGGVGSDVWMLASSITLRPDWEEIKVEEMYKGNKAKFDQHPDMAKDLASSKGEPIFTGSTNFWCKWNSRIMKRIRAEINGDTQVVDEIKKQMEEYAKEQKEIREKKN